MNYQQLVNKALKVGWNHAGENQTLPLTIKHKSLNS